LWGAGRSLQGFPFTLASRACGPLARPLFLPISKGEVSSYLIGLFHRPSPTVSSPFRSVFSDSTLTSPGYFFFSLKEPRVFFLTLRRLTGYLNVVALSFQTLFVLPFSFYGLDIFLALLSQHERFFRKIFLLQLDFYLLPVLGSPLVSYPFLACSPV